MNDETPIELEKGSSDVAMDISTDASSDTPEISHNEQIFDISEDNISPVNEPMPVMEYFPMKKKPVTPPGLVVPPPVSKATPTATVTPVTPKPPEPAPASSFVSAFSKPAVDASPLQKSPFVASAPKPPEPEMPTKNILDPHYSGPGAFTTTNAAIPATQRSFTAPVVPPTPPAKPFSPEPIQPITPATTPTPIQTPPPSVPSTPKIKLPPLAETPAFKGTLDPTPHTFTPTTTTPAPKPEAPKTTTRPALNVYSATTADLVPKTAQPTTPPVAARPTPEPTPVSVPQPSTSPVQKSIGSIPLKDISGPITPASRNTPANPSAKTLGAEPTISGQDSKFQSTENPDLKRLRTYESDVADALSHRKISTASIAIAENKRAQEDSVQIENAQQLDTEERGVDPSIPKSHPILKVFVTLLIFVFILGGIGGAYYLYSKSALAPAPRTNTTSTSNQGNLGEIYSDAGFTINARNLSPLDIVALVRKEYEKSQNPGTIREIILTNGQSRITSTEMIELMDIDAPDMLVRSLVASWMLGIYADEKGDKDVFVVVGTNFFQNAFAGMLQWERVMADDLKLYLSSSARGIANAPVATSSVQVGTSPSSTESSIDPYFTIRGQFEDRIVMNKDVRVFRTSQGKILFLYSFIDNSTLVVATKEKTIAEILGRLEKQAFVR